jgi:hypothetical protein
MTDYGTGEGAPAWYVGRPLERRVPLTPEAECKAARDALCCAQGAETLDCSALAVLSLRRELWLIQSLV